MLALREPVAFLLLANALNHEIHANTLCIVTNCTRMPLNVLTQSLARVIRGHLQVCSSLASQATSPTSMTTSAGLAVLDWTSGRPSLDVTGTTDLLVQRRPIDRIDFNTD